MGPRSPSQHKRRRRTFGVPLADCPMDDDLPLVVTTCCRIIESQIETDCHGIYRTAANERIKNEVEVSSHFLLLVLIVVFLGGDE